MLRFIPKEQESVQVPAEIEALGYPRRLIQLLVQRGISTPEKIEKYLNPKKEDLHDPYLMQDMDKAVAVIRDALEKKERIVIFGDYDVDGVTATSILMTYLRKQGASVGYYIPDRHGEGYGLNMKAIEQIAAEAKLLITVDCGITCPRETERARELGMRVIVTDHHQLGPELPQCEAVLNPLLGQYPCRKLCGAGVAFKLVQALGGKEAIDPLWELAALATVADIVPLLDENRVIVTYGLKAMANTQRPGLMALMESSGVKKESVTSSDVAYKMSPRINAGGRLALASRGVELLTTRKKEIADEAARELDDLNQKRRELELKIFEEADQKVKNEIDFLTEKAIVICGEGWNPGVIGLVASRMVEKYKWPCILLSQDGDTCVGSARSIVGVDIHKALAKCADLFVRFGGHAQAAGLTILAENLPEFKKRLSETIAEQCDPEVFYPAEEYDLELPLHEVDEDLILAFERMQPTGCGNPAPVFCTRNVSTSDPKAIGKDKSHLKMRVSDEIESRDAIAFRMASRVNDIPDRIDMLFTASVNEWKDTRTVQCEIKQFQASVPSKAFLQSCKQNKTLIERETVKQLSSYLLTEESMNDRDNVQYMHIESACRILKEISMRQGILLCAHTVSALQMGIIHLAVAGITPEFSLYEMNDLRFFNTVVLSPDWNRITVQPQVLVMLDGFISEIERKLVIARYPNAKIYAADDMNRFYKLLSDDVLPSDDGLRNLYKVLRKRGTMDQSLSILSSESGLNENAVYCGMMVFNELGLISFTENPIHYQLVSSGKVSLDDSILRKALIKLQ